MRHAHVLTAVIAGSMTLGATSQAQSVGASQDTEAQNRPQPHFVSTDTIFDAEVIPRSESEYAAGIDDLVVDMRNGRIVYAVIDTNGILGSEDRAVAIPYGALSWHPETQQFMLDVTADQLRNLPLYDADNLAHLHDASWFSTLRGVFGEQPELREAESTLGDEYTRYFTHGEPKSISGKVVGVNRQAKTAMGGTCYAVEIQTDAGTQHTVLLAPVSYLTQESHVPSEGQGVTVSAVMAIDADGESVYVAQSIRTEGDTLRLRDGKGVPVWSSEDSDPERTFYVLASNMSDGTLYAQGEEFGDMMDVAFEVHSGAASFAVVSVGGVLGVDDTLYPVPCGAISPGHEYNGHVDMPASELELAPKLSEEGMNDLNNGQFAQRVFEFFEIKSKQFDTNRSSRWSAQQRGADG